MIYKQEDNSFEIFQNLLKRLNYPVIPEKPEDCWKINSYELCQDYLETRRVTPNVLENVSKFILIEKYYWTSVTMFPSRYLGYHNGEKMLDVSKLNKQDQKEFEEEIKDMVQIISQNQRNLGYETEKFENMDNYILEKLQSAWDMVKENQTNDNEYDKKER